MLDDEDEIWDNIDIAFYAMCGIELFETWRNLTDTLGGDFPVVYNKAEFDELIERMPDEKLTELVKKSPDFDENDLYFSIYDGQLYSTSRLDTRFEPIYQSCDKVYKILIEKRLTLGSKRLEAAFTEDFDEDMEPITEELERFFDEEPDELVNEWEKYVEGCKKVGYDGGCGPFSMSKDHDIIDDIRNESWVLTDWWRDDQGCVEEDGYYDTDEISDSFCDADEWFYWNRETGQYCSFSDWDWEISDCMGLNEYWEDLTDYIVQTGDDLGIAGIREILDNHRKLGYVSQKDRNQ